jgi:hypothetical protein
MTMRYRAPWDYEQANQLKRLLDCGATDEEAARIMGRTVEGVRKAMFRYFGSQRPDPIDHYSVGPAIGLTMECKRLRSDAIGGSFALADAVNSLLERMDPALRASCLGVERQAQPGTEPSHKTCSMQRHVTAVQAQKIAA